MKKKTKIRFRYLLFGIMVLLIACTSLSTSDPQAIAYYRYALASEKGGSDQWTRAVRYYKKSLEYDQRFLEAHLALGRLYTERGQLHKAAMQYQSAVMVNPNRTDLYLECGKAMFAAEQYQEALLYLQQYHAFQPKDPEGLYWLAETHRVMNNLLAEDYFLQLIQSDSTKADYWQSLAAFYLYRKDYAQAAAAYAKVIRLSKQPTAQVFFEYGYSLIRLRKWEEAKTILEKAAKIRGTSSRAYDYWQTVTKISLGYFQPQALLDYLDAALILEEIKNEPSRKADYMQAYEYLQSAIKTEPEFIPAQKDFADVCYTLGKDDEALTAYRQVIAAGRASAEDYANAAFLLFRKDQYETALDYYQKSLKIKPDQPNVENSIRTVRQFLKGKRKKEAYFYFDRGLSAESADSAIVYFQKAISLDSLYAEAYLQLGLRLQYTGQYRESEKSLIRGLRLTSDMYLLPEFHFQLGRLYARRDLHDKAIAHFDSVLQFRPEYEDAIYELAKVYNDKSDLPSALRHYDALIRRNPNYFRPSESELKYYGVNPGDYYESTEKIYLANRLVIGQKNRYQLKIKSKNDALLGADANNDFSREMTIVFSEQVLDTTSYGVTELAVEIESVEGYALTPLEKKVTGKMYYLRVSDVFGIVNIYGLIEENPNSLQRLVMHTLEDLHGGRLRKAVAEGELWKSQQYIFKMGRIDGVSVIEELNEKTAVGKKFYNIFGSYDAAKYGEIGKVYIQLDGSASFTFDRQRRLITAYKNEFTTKSFNENTAKLDFQSGVTELTWLDTKYEKMDPPHRVVIADVPYIKQHGPQCAAASLSMILAFYKDTIDQDSIYSAIKSDYAGAQSHDILHYPRSLGRYKSYGYKGNIEDLKNRIDQNMPLIVFLSPYGYGHVVVVIGYDETRHQIIMHDPTIADHHAVSYDEFLQEWRQSGNECALVVPFDQPMNITDGPIASHKAVELKWQGDKLFSRRQYDEAVSLYRNALSVQPDYEGALEGILMVHLSKDRFEEASALLDTLMAMNPGSVELILRNASLLLSQYDYDKVLQLTQKIKQLDESNILNYLYSASALFSQKKYDEAIAEVRKAINLNPLVSTPRTMLSGYLAEKGEYEQAYEQARLAIRYEPENLGNYLNLASIYQAEVRNRFLTGPMRMQKLQAAIDAMKQAESINPNLPNIDLYYADVFAEMEDYKRADSLYLENIRKYPDENTAYNNLAWRWATRSIRLREAEVYSQKSIELSKRNPYYFDTMAWIHFKMAIAFQKAGIKDSADIYFRKAEAELKETIEYDLYSDFAYRHLGVVYERWGMKNLAQSQYDIVTGMLPDKTRAYIEIALDCEEGELYETAIEFYQKALNLKPTMDFAAFRLAYLYIKTGRNPKDALIFAQQALDADPYNFNYLGVNGIVYWALKDYEKAREYLEEAIRLQECCYDAYANSHYYYLGLVYRALNQTAKSLEQFKLYIEKDPYGNYIAEAKKNIIPKK